MNRYQATFSSRYHPIDLIFYINASSPQVATDLAWGVMSQHSQYDMTWDLVSLTEVK